MTAQTEDAKIVGWCSRCEGQNVVLFRGKWTCGCQQSDGGVTRWRRSWTAWEATEGGQTR